MSARTSRQSARIVRTRIRHVRIAPLRHEFRYRSYSWLVDLDDMPAPPRWLRPFADFRAADHLGDPAATLRRNVEDYLAEHDIDLRGGRVLMLTNARVLGYVFNPLTLYWCRDDTGAPVCVIAEVHNTYGGRHRYLLRPDDSGRAHTDKQFYVSPFNDVSGDYRMRVPEPDDRLRVSIVLSDGDPIFAAAMTGRCHPATPATILRATLTAPLAPLVVSARIRWQGVRLWARRLPVAPRPTPALQEPSR
ncbi:DUF1365 domain-containing protein [Nocardia arizonensis]|uniref:DUF1365 domain-containing protein n=1 Tax=Nocardia arizonensis TaxID=1141647 RepID=UPI0006D0A109|nr:DUF1365 domain-containing protein [Nocardia arizonensis]